MQRSRYHSNSFKLIKTVVKDKIYTIYLHYANSFDNLVSKFSPGFFTATQQAYVPPSMRGQNMPTRKLHEYEPPSNLKQQQQQPGRSGLYIYYSCYTEAIIKYTRFCFTEALTQKLNLGTNLRLE